MSTQRVFGIIAEFKNPHDLLNGVRAVRQAGLTRIDTHTPFPVHGMDNAMGLPPSNLPWVVFAGALTGTSSAVLLQWWMNAYDYQLLVAGKPVFSYQAYVPVMFELTVLLGAFCAVFGLLAFCGLPKPYHPLFTNARFGRSSDDAFILSVEAEDPNFEEGKVRAVLSQAGGQEIAIVTDIAEEPDAGESNAHG